MKTFIVFAALVAVALARVPRRRQAHHPLSLYILPAYARSSAHASSHASAHASSHAISHASAHANSQASAHASSQAYAARPVSPPIAVYAKPIAPPKKEAAPSAPAVYAEPLPAAPSVPALYAEPLPAAPSIPALYSEPLPAAPSVPALYAEPLPAASQDAPRISNPIVLVKETPSDNVGLDSYRFSFEQSDGQKREESAVVDTRSNPEKAILRVTGSYSYVGDDGKTYTVTYIADENGFQAQGAHLPVAPKA